MNIRRKQYAKVFRQTNKPAYFSTILDKMQKGEMQLEEMEYANYILLVNKRAFCAYFRNKREKIKINLAIITPPDLSNIKVTTSIV